MKNLFKQIVIWVKSVLGGLLDHFKVFASIAVDITAKLKFIVESEALDTTVDLIPGNLDNKILDKVRLIIPFVVKKVSIASGIASESDSNSEAIDKFIAHLKSLNPEGRKVFWVTFAAELNIALSDGKISFSEAVILTQLIYTEFIKNRI